MVGTGIDASGQSCLFHLTCPPQTGTAAVATDGMLAPTPALIERLAGQERHVEVIQDRDRLGELVGGGSLESALQS